MSDASRTAGKALDIRPFGHPRITRLAPALH